MILYPNKWILLPNGKRYQGEIDKANVAMTNLTYNIARTAQVFKYHRNWITA